MAQNAEAREIEFDEPTHTYRYRGRVVPGVNEVLKAAGVIDDRWFTEESRRRGKAVHQAINYILNDDLHFESLHEKIQPYVSGMVDFLRDIRFKAIRELCEVPQVHPQYLYCGTPDMVGVLNARVVLIDADTGNSKTKGYQTAAYAAFPAIAKLAPDRFQLRLMPNGRYKLIPLKDPEDFYFFISSLKRARENQLLN